MKSDLSPTRLKPYHMPGPKSAAGASHIRFYRWLQLAPPHVMTACIRETLATHLFEKAYRETSGLAS